VSRDFLPSVFFHQSTPPWALIHRLKLLRIWLQNRQEIRDNCLKFSASAASMRPLRQFQWGSGSGFDGFNETTEAASAAPMRPWKWLRRFQWDRGIHKKISTILIYTERYRQFSAQNYIEKSLASMVSMRQRKQIRWYQWNRGSGFSNVNETAEADSAVSMSPRKRIQRSQWERRILSDAA
jgi:hypothetical protein